MEPKSCIKSLAIRNCESQFMDFVIFYYYKVVENGLPPRLIDGKFPIIGRIMDSQNVSIL